VQNNNRCFVVEAASQFAWKSWECNKKTHNYIVILAENLSSHTEYLISDYEQSPTANYKLHINGTANTSYIPFA